MNNGTHIKDGVIYSGGATSADQIAYDNTNSGLEATNTQEAVDELSSDLTELKEDFSFYYEITTANTLYAQGIPLDVKYVLLDACYHNNGVHCFMLVPRNLITGITHLARVYTPGGWAELGWSSTQMQSGSLPANYRIRVYTK